MTSAHFNVLAGIKRIGKFYHALSPELDINVCKSINVMLRCAPMTSLKSARKPEIHGGSLCSWSVD